jgi:hypothetical protein
MTWIVLRNSWNFLRDHDIVAIWSRPTVTRYIIIVGGEFIMNSPAPERELRGTPIQD